jgi:hypothetical protein
MPLDVAFTPKTLTATLHYLKRGAEKPAYYRIEPPPGTPRWNGEDDLREVSIEDARGRENEFTLDRNGFQLVKAPTTMRDFYDPDEIKRAYYPEVEQLLKDKLGASRVLCSTTMCAMPRSPAWRCRHARCTMTTRSPRRRGGCVTICPAMRRNS